jgi:hypothetical protein
LACGVVKAHRAQEELIARFNDENPPHIRGTATDPGARGARRQVAHNPGWGW